MKELFSMFGVITTVDTPFNEDLSINWTDLRRTAEAALEAGVSGFLAPCFASEIDDLNEEERYRMARELVDVTRAAGHGIVIPNVRGKDKEACELAESLHIHSLVLWHTEDKRPACRKELYTAEGRQYYSGNLFVPDDREIIPL